MITYYTETDTKIVVCVNGRIFGFINQVIGGFSYSTKDSNLHGEVFKTVKEVKQSLEKGD